MDAFGELQRLSTALLGGAHRLRIAALIAGLKVEFRTSEVNRASELSPSAVSKELRHFADAGVLLKIGHGQWRRRHDDFWQGCRALHSELAEEDAGTAIRGVLHAVKE